MTVQAKKGKFVSEKKISSFESANKKRGERRLLQDCRVIPPVTSTTKHCVHKESERNHCVGCIIKREKSVSSYHFPFEVNVSPEKSLIQGLNGTEVVAKRSFWQFTVSLHHFAKRVHLEKNREKKVRKGRRRCQ